MNDKINIKIQNPTKVKECSNLNSKSVQNITGAINEDKFINDIGEEDILLFIKNASIPIISQGEDHLLSEDYFNSSKLTAKKCLIMVENLLTNSVIFSKQNRMSVVESKDTFLKNFVVETVLLCGEHSSQFMWSDSQTIEYSNNVINKLVEFFDCSFSGVLFLSHDNFNDKLKAECTTTVLSSLLCSLNRKLKSDNWKLYPAAIECYQWILNHIKFPYMDVYFTLLFPPALQLLEDYKTENKIVGLKCITHIWKNMDEEQLIKCIECNILFSKLKPLLYWREKDLIVPLVECLLEVIDKLKSPRSNMMWCMYRDESLSIILPLMEYEQDINLRLKYTEALELILARTDVSISRWSRCILRILQNYTLFTATSMGALKVLVWFIKKCFPVCKKYWQTMALISGKLLLTSKDDHIINLARSCYLMVYRLRPAHTFMVPIEEILGAEK